MTDYYFNHSKIENLKGVNQLTNNNKLNFNKINIKENNLVHKILFTV